MGRIRRPLTRLRWPTAAAAGLVALGPASALAQLPEPQLPLPKPVQDVSREPAEPVEQVVQESPVAPVYTGARETVENLTGTGSGGGGGGGGSSGGGSAGGGGGSSQSTPRSAGSTTPSGGGPRSTRSRSGGDRARGGGATRAGQGRGGARGPAARRRDGGAGRGVSNAARRAEARERARRAANVQEEDESSGPIGDIVEVIPTPVLIALGLLAALALALNARAGLVRRRAGWLEREREQLLLDVGVLQRALLPPVPGRLGALSASVAYSPADGPGAGGDFYDAFELPDDRVGVIVGDVAGHGRQALVKTASVRHTLAAYVRGGLSPRAAVGTVGALLSDTDDSSFTTVVLAVHDRATGRLTYASAGHPPPIFQGPAAHEPVTTATSPPLGVGEPTGLRQTTVTLPAGSVVCLFTDGLLEARVGEELLGRERLTAMVAGLGPDAGADALLEAVAEEADETPDDMAACVLRAVEGPQGPSHRIEELELWGDLEEMGGAERFLGACGLRGEALVSALADASEALTAFGTALLRVTYGDDGVEVAVTPHPATPAPSLLPDPPAISAEAL